MRNPFTIVLMVDAWRARSMGAYGNTWYPTPALDRIASQGLVFDRYLGTSNQLPAVYDAVWTSKPPAHDSPPPQPIHLLQHLAELGYFTHLVTDEPEVTRHGEAQRFDRQTFIEPPEARPAAEVFDTAMGRVLEAAADVVGEWSAEYEQPRLLWVHLRGFRAPWDAPGELAASLTDEDDPTLEPAADVPAFTFADAEEAADRVFLASCRYAGQVMALDRCLGALDELLAELSSDAPPTLILGGTRGFALGEHGTVGPEGGPYGELFHLPLVVRGPGVPSLVRCSHLVQTSDLPALLVDAIEGRPLATRRRQTASGQTGDGQRFLQTDDWHFVARETGSELYVKPDDLWEANDVATLCPDEVDQFTQLLGKTGH